MQVELEEAALFVDRTKEHLEKGTNARANAQGMKEGLAMTAMAMAKVTEEWDNAKDEIQDSQVGPEGSAVDNAKANTQRKSIGTTGGCSRVMAEPMQPEEAREKILKPPARSTNQAGPVLPFGH